MTTGRRLSSFSVLLIMVALMIIGAAMIPLLSIQHTPTEKPNWLSISYNWNNAPARLVEQEVSSTIEGAIARMDGISNISSLSYKGGGRVDVSFKKNVKMDVARFEAASIIRNIYSRLPDGVSYPYISLSVSGNNEPAVLSYTINSAMPPAWIGEYLDNNVLSILSRVDGVNRIDIGGVNPYEYEIVFQPEKAMLLGITGNEIAGAFQSYFSEDALGYIRTDEEGNLMWVRLRNAATSDFGSISIKKSGSTVIYLRDIATVKYSETLPSSYFRINGLNTVNITIYPEKGVNIITLATQLRTKMKEIEKSFPTGMSAILNFDSSEYIAKELNKIAVRTAMTLGILLLFVLLVSRRWNYLLVIASTMFANILIAVIFYYIFDVDIHIYSLAGLTVSLGIIIDTSIIMADHYSYYRDRRAFTALLGAILTTIASLCVIFFLPQQQRLILADFAQVIIINLAVSLIISFLFIPTFIDKFPLGKGIASFSRHRARNNIRINRFYGNYIRFVKKWKWACIVTVVLSFGIPLQLLPEKIKPGYGAEPGRWAELYNVSVGSGIYQEHKETIEKVFGGALRLFINKTSSAGFYRDPVRPSLTIRAGMPEGCTVQQLNEVLKFMENFLSKFDEIDMFRTNIWAHDNSSIEVTFKPEYEKTGFPQLIKREVISAVNNYGGATWNVYGIDDQAFNNNVMSTYKSNRIILRGYNYDQLLEYANGLVDTLERNRRVSLPQVYTQVGWSVPQNEFLMEFDKQRLAMFDINLNDYLGFIGQLLYNRPLMPVFMDNRYESASLISSRKDEFDLWNVQNNPQIVDSVLVKFSDIGTVVKKPTGLDIFKNNQTYELCVAFDFVGSFELANQVIKTQVERMNEEVLPIGYKVEHFNWGWGGKEAKKQVWLLLLVIVIIYFICAIIFESLVKPLVIIFMIPVSFVGVFLMFGLTDIKFDQGGFAAFIFLSGIVVNAGIYIINEYNIICSSSNKGRLESYIKAFNRKIIPISLTVLSTVLGLLPFLYKGKDDVFWYAFATGTMGGLTFSLIVLVFLLPVFMPLKIKKTDARERMRLK